MSYLEKTTSGMSDGNRKIWTLSFWMKRAKLSSEQFLWSWGENNSNDGKLLFGSGDQLVFMNDGQCGSNQTMTRALRDTNGWYHIVWRCKADESSNDDRWKFYINGELIPASEYSSPSISNADGIVNKWSTQDNWHCGNARSQQSGSINPFYGILSHIHFCDGYAYDASDFGETDTTTGEWKIKTSPSVSYGTNGYFILKNGNSGTDESPNSNNFTAVGTITKTEDNPSNVFATLQGLFLDDNDLTLSNGNTKVVEGSDNWRSAYSSLGASSGKFYCEAKVTYQNNTEAYVGVSHEDHLNGTASFGGSWGGVQNSGYDYVGYSDKSVSIYSTGDQDYPSTVNVGDTWQSSGDIMSIAMDLDNNKVYFAKNGVWANGSGGWGSSTFDSSVGGQTIASGLTFFGFSPNQSTFEVNFGNGYFGTTAISSEGTNASGIGKFEYDVPTGYTALSTKGLNE